MSAGNRLTKEELRSEVKEYLITLREERVQRSIEVKERLRELRLARIERLHDVRTSLAVMESMRLKAQLEDSREDLRDRVQQLREEARSMLKQYSETRKKGFANVDKAAEELVEVLSSVEEEVGGERSEDQAVLGGHLTLENLPRTVSTYSKDGEDKEIRAEASEEEEEPYQNILSRVVTGLRGKDAKKEKKVNSVGNDNSLMGKIRRLANGEYQSSRAVPASERIIEQTSISTPIATQPAVEAKTTPKQEAVQRAIVETPTVRPVQKPAVDPAPIVVSTGISRQSASEKNEQNELLDIAGIGPSVYKRLERIGICTLQDLASTDVSHLERSFGEYAKLADLGEWIREARLKIRANG